MSGKGKGGKGECNVSADALGRWRRWVGVGA
jgi:hypothetical protein